MELDFLNKGLELAAYDTLNIADWLNVEEIIRAPEKNPETPQVT